MRWVATTKQTYAIVSLIAALSELMPEVELCVSESRIYMRKALRYDTVLISVDMPSERFDEYVLEGTTGFTLLMPSEVAIKILHTSAITDTLSLRFNSDNPHTVSIVLLTERTKREFAIPAQYTPRLMKLSVEPKTRYNRVLHMHTKQLSFLAHNLLPNSDEFIVTARDDQLTFHFENCVNSCVSAGRVVIGQRKSAHAEPYAKCRFKSAAMAHLVKCFALHQVCNFLVADDAPLVIELQINELGVMTVALMPVAYTPPEA